MNGTRCFNHHFFLPFSKFRNSRGLDSHSLWDSQCESQDFSFSFSLGTKSLSSSSIHESTILDLLCYNFLLHTLINIYSRTGLETKEQSHHRYSLYRFIVSRTLSNFHFFLSFPSLKMIHFKRQWFVTHWVKEVTITSIAFESRVTHHILSFTFNIIHPLKCFCSILRDLKV